MARVTDTRAQVRRLAQELLDKGTKPTPTLIKQLLGRGSPNTIVSELKAWAAERDQRHDKASSEENVVEGVSTKKSQGTRLALESVGASELAQLVLNSARAADSIASSLRESQSLLADLKSVPLLLTQVSEGLQAINDQLINDRAWMREELEKAYSRY